MVMCGENCGEGDVFFFHRFHDDLGGHGIDDGSLLCGLIHDQVHVVVGEGGKDSDLHLGGHIHERLGGVGASDAVFQICVPCSEVNENVMESND